MITYICYIDGSYISSINNKIGYAFLIIKDNCIIDMVADSFVSKTKLNSCLSELMCFLFAIQNIYNFYKNIKFEIFTDSKYIVEIFNNQKTAHVYLETWDCIFKLTKQLDLKLMWIKAHNNNKFNNLCDYLAKRACDKDLKINIRV